MPKTTRTTNRTSTVSNKAASSALHQTSRKRGSGIDEFVEIVTSRPVADQKAAYKVLKSASRHGQD